MSIDLLLPVARLRVGQHGLLQGQRLADDLVARARDQRASPSQVLDEPNRLDVEEFEVTRAPERAVTVDVHRPPPRAQAVQHTTRRPAPHIGDEMRAALDAASRISRRKRTPAGVTSTG